MGKLPILLFNPVLKELVWGGRRLEKALGKALPEHALFGESWEIADLPTDQSIVRCGPLKGVSLSQLCRTHGEALMGKAPLTEGRFPLLFKFIDANQRLSVQVHPDRAACERLGGGARPKTEAWYIIDRLPDAVLYVGLKPGVTRKEFADAVSEHRVEALLHKLKVSRGDFIYLPSGTVHAIGSGVLLAEVQQSSDTTYRLFDWDRVGLDGKPRKLHLEKAIESIDFSTFETPSIVAPPSGRPGLVSDYFIMENVYMKDSDVVLEGEGPLVLMSVGGGGRVEVAAGDETLALTRGQTCLVPACIAEEVVLEARGENILLAIRIP